MTVSELMERLETLDPDSIVSLSYRDDSVFRRHMLRGIKLVPYTASNEVSVVLYGGTHGCG